MASDLRSSVPLRRSRWLVRNSECQSLLACLLVHSLLCYSIKAWDLRSSLPIVSINTRAAAPTKLPKRSKREQESKVLCVQWGGPRTILGAGSDTTLHIHEFGELSR